MITTKAGHPVTIIEGDLKCVHGNKAFLVRPDYSVLNPRELYLMITKGVKGRPFKLRRDELIADSEQELLDAIK